MIRLFTRRINSFKANPQLQNPAMKKTILTLSAIAASSLVVSAQAPVFSNNFGTGYTNGDLSGEHVAGNTVTATRYPGRICK
jgi:hypothetical protein